MLNVLSILPVTLENAPASFDLASEKSPKVWAKDFLSRGKEEATTLGDAYGRLSRIVGGSETEH